VLSVITAGLTYRQAQTLFANRVEVPCQSIFYRLQKWAAPLIIDKVKSSYKCVPEKMNADSCLGFDGSWSW
jgi:hypothetical protein